MEYLTLQQTDLKVSKIALGCMRIADNSIEEVEELVKTALESGILIHPKAIFDTFKSVCCNVKYSIVSSFIILINLNQFLHQSNDLLVH